MRHRPAAHTHGRLHACSAHHRSVLTIVLRAHHHGWPTSSCCTHPAGTSSMLHIICSRTCIMLHIILPAHIHPRSYGAHHPARRRTSSCGDVILQRTSSCRRCTHPAAHIIMPLTWHIIVRAHPPVAHFIL
ncbi:unnamed protein product [Pleuronectes platessa]|uniref:Uncharacterized protein n=1 Tax=Pleuronectes platessa TaxID=8262 RepID=A0A9N7TPB9_PLEPL|nr:unnamed protein product [Pleuronectes platessa]